MPTDLSVSTIRSDPGRTTVRGGTAGGVAAPVSLASCRSVGAGSGAPAPPRALAPRWPVAAGSPGARASASAVGRLETSAVAPAAAAAAALFRKPRRSNDDLFDLAMWQSPCRVRRRSELPAEFAGRQGLSGCPCYRHDSPSRPLQPDRPITVVIYLHGAGAFEAHGTRSDLSTGQGPSEAWHRSGFGSGVGR